MNTQITIPQMKIIIVPLPRPQATPTFSACNYNIENMGVAWDEANCTPCGLLYVS